MHEVDLEVGEGHETVDDELVHLQLGRSFLAGPHGDDTIMRLRWYRRLRDGALVGRVWWGPGAQGPPGHAHGGSMAAVLDEALGSSAWIAGHAVVAVELQTTFRKLLPLGAVYSVEAWVERVEGRKVFTRGRIFDAEGTDYTTATGIFVAMSEEQFRGLLDFSPST